MAAFEYLSVRHAGLSTAALAAPVAPAVDDAFIVGSTAPFSGNLFINNGFGPDPTGNYEIARIDGVAVAVGDTVTLASGALLTIGANGAFTYDPNGALSPNDPVDRFTYAALQYPARVDLFGLDGTDGFRIDGATAGDSFGAAVSPAGDVNGDGIDDFIVGAPGFQASGKEVNGASYVVYGSASGFPTVSNVATLGASEGFRIDGTDQFNTSGGSVSGAGDVNGDGFDDVITSTAGRFTAGEAYVVFGAASGRTVVDPADLDGSNGFRLHAQDGSFDGSRIAVSSAGDFNGDGFDDVIVGAPDTPFSGASYIVFGKDGGFAPDLDLPALDGHDGFRVVGIHNAEHLGASVSSAGDINGDGFDDVVIGTYPYCIKCGIDYPQYSYVVFGAAGGFLKSLAVGRLDGSNGFRIDSDPTVGNAGRSVSGAGDVNGDGYDDIVISTANASPDGQRGAGASYIVFGSAAGFAPTIQLAALDGSDGFRIDGPAAYANVGSVVSRAGDVNGDGFDDVVLVSSPLGRATTEAYVIYGGADFHATLDLAHLKTSEGFRVEDGSLPSEFTFLSASGAGDVNHDGYDDLLFGVTGSQGSQGLAGRTFVVYGGPSLGAEAVSGPATVTVSLTNTVTGATNGADTLTGTAAADSVNGRGGGDLIAGVGGDDLVKGGSGNDTLRGDAGNDQLNGGDGADRLFGGDGHDGLLGSAGDDVLFGGAGNDFLVGGAGIDRFAVAADDGAGRDIIRDFANGTEVVELTDLSVVGVRDILRADGTPQATVTLDDGGKIVFRGLLAGDIDASDFAFVGSGSFFP